MASEGSNTDEDLFALGTFSAGNIVELTAVLPSSSTLVPDVALVDSTGAAVGDEDGSPDDAAVLPLSAGGRSGEGPAGSVGDPGRRPD